MSDERQVAVDDDPTTPAQIDQSALLAGGSVPPAPAETGVVGVRGLIGASFDLLLRVGDPLRRASFYIGVVMLATVGPLVLAFWGMVVVGYDVDIASEAVWQELGVWLAVLGTVATAGFVVASIESQALVVALLGGHAADRPVTVRAAVQRSRMVFWSVIAASLLVAIPTVIVQALIGQESQGSVLLGIVVGIALQAPFVYATAGIVLGGVGAVEALKRSVRLVRARKAAALVLALLPTAFGLLILVGFESGLDVALRATDALGLGSDSGPAGLAVLTVLLVALVFAVGTLLLTATGIIYAPQAVMFVALTRATMGLDPVRPGGERSPDDPARGPARFRWLTRPMLIGMALSGLGMAALLATASG